MARHRPAIKAFVLIAALGLIAGCSPLLPLLGAVLGGPEGKSQLAGPFAGAPSATQNYRPTDPRFSDALASADQQIRPSCVAKLPPSEPAPDTGCTMRPTCLPGSEQPMRLRLCAGDPGATLSELARPAASDWRWADDR